jgi:hypothetical protein
LAMAEFFTIGPAKTQASSTALGGNEVLAVWRIYIYRLLFEIFENIPFFYNQIDLDQSSWSKNLFMEYICNMHAIPYTCIYFCISICVYFYLYLYYIYYMYMHGP